MKKLLVSPLIYTDHHGLKHGELTEKLIGIFYEVYNELGHGFLEAVYGQAFSIALSEKNVFFEREVAVPVWFHGRQIGDYRPDFLVERKVIVELKTVRDLSIEHEKQVLNYLRATDIEVALLFNFGERPTFRRYLFDNEKKRIRAHPC